MLKPFGWDPSPMAQDGLDLRSSHFSGLLQSLPPGYYAGATVMRYQREWPTVTVLKLRTQIEVAGFAAMDSRWQWGSVWR